MRELNTERIIDNLNKNHRKNEEILYDINSFISLIENYLENSEKEKVLFSEFNELSEIMNIIDIDGEKQLEYITSFVEENINTGLLSEEPNKLNMSYDDYEMITHITEKFQIKISQEMLSKIYEKYIKKESLQIWEEQVLEIMLKSIKETNNFRDLMKNIKERYLQKKDNYIMDDVKEIIKTLETMGVTQESNIKIKRTLVKKYKERKYSDNTKPNIEKPIYVTTEEVKDENNNKSSNPKQYKVRIYSNNIKPKKEKTLLAPTKEENKNKLLTSKQYKEILNTLKRYIIFDGMQLKEEVTVTQEERIMLASNLLLVGYNERDVKKFIYNSDLIYQLITNNKKDKTVIENISLEELIRLYQGNVDRYVYYNDNNSLEIEEIIDTINLYIELSKEESNEEMLEEIKKEIYNNMLILNNIVTHNYKYELEKIKEEKIHKKKILENQL